MIIKKIPSTRTIQLRKINFIQAFKMSKMKMTTIKALNKRSYAKAEL